MIGQILCNSDVMYCVCSLETDLMLHWMSQEPLSIVKCTNKSNSTERPYYLKVSINHALYQYIISPVIILYH